MRRTTKQLIKVDPEEERRLFPYIRDISDVWGFAKDGKKYYSGKDYNMMFSILRK